MTIALSIFRDRITSRLDSGDNILLLSVENGHIISRKTIRIIPSSLLDKIYQIIELNPDVLICGGLKQFCTNKLNNASIRVIPWIKGDAEEVLMQFLNGQPSKRVTTANNMS